MVLYIEAENGPGLNEYKMKFECPPTVKIRLEEDLRMVTEQIRPKHRLIINCQNTNFLNPVLRVRHTGSLSTSSDFTLKVFVKYDNKWTLRSTETVRVTPPE